MIKTYHRPTTLEEALTYLARPNALPLGGGTLLCQPGPASVEVVDLQALGLNRIHKKGNNLEIGATVTLQQLLESEHCPVALKTAIKLEAPLNLRNAATVAGRLVACDGRSSFDCALLAMDAKLSVFSDQSFNDQSFSNQSFSDQSFSDQSFSDQSSVVGIGEFLPLRPRGLITQIVIPLNARFAFEYVARTPSDKPIVCAALAQWNSGRTRLALGGWGRSPTLAMDGTEAEGLETAARNACHEAADDWGSAEYRMDVAATLAKRCLESIETRQ